MAGEAMLVGIAVGTFVGWYVGRYRFPYCEDDAGGVGEEGDRKGGHPSGPRRV